MRKYRKKPIVISAIQVPALGKEPSDALIILVQLEGWEGNDTGIIIPTLEGNMIASPGDYIIKGIKGEYYPCKPDVFNATYDEVSPIVGEKEHQWRATTLNHGSQQCAVCLITYEESVAIGATTCGGIT